MIIFEPAGSDIIIRGRHEDGSRYTERRKYKPYFYVEDPNGEFKGLKGEKLKKIILNHPGQTKTERAKYHQTWEADVTYANRYMIDNIAEIKKEPIRMAFLDIETDDEGSFPDMIKADKMILSITVYDSFKEKYHTFAVVPDPVIIDSKTSNIIKSENRNLYLFYKEEEMLQNFTRFFELFDFDIVWAWNGDDFDYPYIFRRYRALGMDYAKLGPMHDIDSYTMKPRGRAWLDQMILYQKMLTSKLESKALDYVAKRELGRGKIPFEGKVSHLWKTDFDKFLDYNINDVALQVGIEQSKGMLKYFDNLRRMAYCSWYDLPHNSRVLDFYNLHKAHLKGVVLPSIVHGIHHEEIEGARVIDPIPGLHDMVAACDVRSLYPSAIMLGNMSPETIVPDDVDLPKIKIYNTTYRTDIRGFIPEVISDLWDWRQSLKSEMKNFEVGSKEYEYHDGLQTVAKFLLNSEYGVLIMPGSRYYVREMGESITYFGRRFNHYMEDTATSFGVKIVMGDTDSLMFTVDSIEQAVTVAKAINDGVEAFLQSEFGDSRYNIIFVEMEKIYSKLFLLGDEDKATKKRYAGLIYWKGKVLDKPVIDIKGFDAVRSDSPKFIRNLQKEVLVDILNGKNKLDIVAKLKTMKSTILNKKYSGEELGVPKGMSKLPHEYRDHIPAHVSGVIYSNMYLGTNIKRDKVKYIYVTRVPHGLPRTKVISFVERMPEGFEIDYRRMAESLVDTKFKNIFLSMKWNLLEIDGIEQKTNEGNWW